MWLCVCVCGCMCPKFEATQGIYTTNSITFPPAANLSLLPPQRAVRQRQQFVTFAALPASIFVCCRQEERARRGSCARLTHSESFNIIQSDKLSMQILQNGCQAVAKGSWEKVLHTYEREAPFEI